MKYFFLFTILFLSISTSFSQLMERCSFYPFLERDKIAHPFIETRIAEIEAFTQDWISKHQNQLSFRSHYTIPVVVHIVWKSEEENLSDTQIFEQIEILNTDYRALNNQQNSIPIAFKSIMADTQIEFCLAAIDPQGNPTTGITRTQTFTDNIGSTSHIYYSDEEGADAWDNERYLNIWVCDFGDNFLGFGSAPGEKIPEEDGVIIDYRFFGKSNHPNYGLGRTTTHEVGHYLNLRHPWGSRFNNNDCLEDDQVLDTPKQATSYTNKCPNEPQFSCGSSDMYMNYMNYTEDACMGMFTVGQKLRMLATLHGPRLRLTNPGKCAEENTPSVKAEITLFPNPFINNLYLQLYRDDLMNASIKIALYDLAGRIVYGTEMVSSATNFHHIIETTNLSSGLYTLTVNLGSKRWGIKVVKF